MVARADPRAAAGAGSAPTSAHDLKTPAAVSRARRRLLIELGACTLLFAIGNAVLEPHRFAVHAWANAWWTGSSGYCALRCFRTARRSSAPHLRSAWNAFGAGPALWTLGMLWWSWRELVQWELTPFPEVSDIGYLGLVPCFAVGLFKLCGVARTRSVTYLRLGDLGLVACVMLIVNVVLLYEPIRRLHPSTLYMVSAVAYPVMHMAALLFALLCLWQHVMGQHRRVLVILIVGFAVLTGTVSVYAHSLIVRTYEAGRQLDVLWAVAFHFMSWASFEAEVLFARGPIPVQDDEVMRGGWGFEALVPAASLLCVVGVVFGYPEELARPLTRFLLPASVALALCLGLREWSGHWIERALTARVHAREERLRSVVDNSSAIIFLKDEKGKYVLVNRAFAEALGCDPDAVIGKTDHELFPRDIADALNRNDRRVLATHTPITYDEQMIIGGKPHDLLSAKFPLFDVERRAYAVCGVATDVTERRHADAKLHELERKLAEASRLEALGLMAGTIAHDFNNLLGLLLIHADLLEAEIAPSRAARESIAQMKLAARKGADLVKQLTSYAGRARTERLPTDVNGLLEETAGVLRARLSASTTLDVDLDPRATVVEGDPTQLGQVFLNLMTNALDALEGEPGTVRVTSRVVAAGEVAGMNGPCVRVEISDTGRGMDDATLARIFEPFFTTKANGTGLGLAAVRGILARHGGDLSVTSRVGQGTTFRVHIPFARAPSITLKTGP